MDRSRINIATALNSKYMRYTCVMLTSLLENQRNTFSEISIYVLHHDLSEDDIACLDGLVTSYGGTLTLLSIDTTLFPDRLPQREHWPVEIYFRLLLPDLLPAEVDRILYLDVDIIVDKPLDGLYFTDFEDNILCACADPVSKIPFGSRQDIIFQEQIKAGFTYFCSGVLLFDISSMRGRYSFKSYMELAEKLDYMLEAPDQDLLNYMHWRETKLLDPLKYNLFAGIAYCNGLRYKQVKHSAVIIHFAGNKPWNGKSLRHEIDGIWWDYAKKTPFYHQFLEEFVDGSIHSVFFEERLKWYDEKQLWREEKEELTKALNDSALLLQKLSSRIK